VTARDDLLSASRDWKANFRLKRRFRAIRGRQPWRAKTSGPAMPLLILMAGGKIGFQNRMRFAGDMPGRWGLQPLLGLTAEVEENNPFD
jgi:hypothetical protein